MILYIAKHTCPMEGKNVDRNFNILPIMSLKRKPGLTLKMISTTTVFHIERSLFFKQRNTNHSLQELFSEYHNLSDTDPDAIG